MKQLSSTAAVVCQIVANIAAVVFAIVLFTASRHEKVEVTLIGGGIVLLISIPAIIASTLLHYRCWKAVPGNIARTTPGAAIGLLFVPFFNFYWYFVSYAGLAEDSAKALKLEDSQRGLGIALGIFSILGWTVVAQGLGLILVALVHFVIWLIFTLQMVKRANRLMEARTAHPPDADASPK